MTSTDPYRTVARFYDLLIEPANVKLKDIGVTMAPPEPGLTLLDVGCGTGTMLERYAAGGCEVTGLDASAAMLAQARRRLGPGAHLHLGDAARMPFADAAFDLVVMTMVLHEMPPQLRSAVLAEAIRVLDPQGRLLLIDYAAGPWRFPKGWLLKAFVTTVEALAGAEHFRGYRHFLRHGGLPALARRHELQVAHRRVIGGGNLELCVLRPAPA